MLCLGARLKKFVARRKFGLKISFNGFLQCEKLFGLYWVGISALSVFQNMRMRTKLSMSIVTDWDFVNAKVSLLKRRCLT